MGWRMKSKIFNAGNRLINVLFFIFIVSALLFALTSPNLIIGDNQTLGTSTTLVTTYLVLSAVALFIALYCHPKLQRSFKWLL